MTIKTARSRGWMRRRAKLRPCVGRPSFVRLSRVPSHESRACPPWRVTAFPWPPSTVDRGWRLIGTRRLEFPATPTKQTSHAFSNRDTLGGFQSEDLSRRRVKLAPGAKSVCWSKLHHLAADSKELTRRFLIANAGLEFRLTHSKQTQLEISNRKWIAFSQFGFCRSAERGSAKGPAQTDAPGLSGTSWLLSGEDADEAGRRRRADAGYVVVAGGGGAHGTTDAIGAGVHWMKVGHRSGLRDRVERGIGAREARFAICDAHRIGDRHERGPLWRASAGAAHAE